MDPILAAYQKLTQDRSDLNGLYATKATTAAAVVKATNDDQVAGNALQGGVATFEADKTALVTMIQNTLNSGPPAAPPAPPAATDPAAPQTPAAGS